MILVTGATGNVGSETVRLLAGRRRPLRAFARNIASVPALDGVEAIAGDFASADSLNAAMRGVQTVVLVSPAIPEEEIAVIDSAVREGVEHIVKITSKASADSPVARRRGQALIEAHLAIAGPAYTLLRNNAYLQNLLALATTIRQTDGFVMSAGDGEVGMIDTRDVAAVAAAIAADPAPHSGRTYWPTGPALVSYADIAAELSTTLGRDIEYRRLTPQQHLAAMIDAGVPEPVATSNAQAFALIAEGDAAWVTEDVQTVTGTRPRDLRTFLADHRSAFV